MKCPFCDEGINPAAKYCPKCGLPLKEDATIMGGYLTDDSGPNAWVIGGGGVAIVAIALTIGWLSSNRGQNTETVRREPVKRFSAPAPPAPRMAPMQPFVQTASAATQPVAVGSGASTSNNIRWASNPMPKPVRQVRPAEPPAPPAPTHVLATTLRNQPRLTGYVARVVQAGPVAPPTSSWSNYSTPQGSVSVSPVPTLGQPGGFDQVASAGGSLVYDPVSERYAMRPPSGAALQVRNERVRMEQPRSSGTRGAARRTGSPAPANSGYESFNGFPDDTASRGGPIGVPSAPPAATGIPTGPDGTE